MTSLERMKAAMRLQKPDRVPVMCQPSWGFVLKELPDLDPIDFWHNHDSAIRADIRQRLAIGKTARGYILGTACAVAPATPAEHLALLREMVDADRTY